MSRGMPCIGLLYLAFLGPRDGLNLPTNFSLSPFLVQGSCYCESIRVDFKYGPKRAIDLANTVNVCLCRSLA